MPTQPAHEQPRGIPATGSGSKVPGGRQVPKGGGAWKAELAQRRDCGEPYHLWSEGVPSVMLGSCTRYAGDPRPCLLGWGGRPPTPVGGEAKGLCMIPELIDGTQEPADPPPP